MLPPDIADLLRSETGIFELGSVAILGTGALLGIAVVLRRFSFVRLAGALVATALLLRELDFQKRFTYRSIESIGFYTRPIASTAEKIVGFAVLATAAVALGILARAAWSRFRTALREREPWLASMAVAGGLVGTSLVSEKFLGFTVAEEVLEMGFAGAVVALIWQTRPAMASEQRDASFREGPLVRLVTELTPQVDRRASSQRDDRAA